MPCIGCEDQGTDRCHTCEKIAEYYRENRIPAAESTIEWWLAEDEPKRKDFYLTIDKDGDTTFSYWSGEKWVTDYRNPEPVKNDVFFYADVIIPERLISDLLEEKIH